MSVRCESVIPTLAVGDVAAAIAWYRDTLGFREEWRWGDPVVHAAVRLDEVEIHLSCTEPKPGGSWLYFVIDDVDGLHARLGELGVEPQHPPRDQEWDMREMPIVDLVGNQLTFASPHPGSGPSIPIERETVELRLERRLLAVLRDVADLKGLTPSEALEETLLHTFEPMPDGGVASPHTVWQLERIQELKERHGIDYDVHGSYRFTEDDAEE